MHRLITNCVRTVAPSCGALFVFLLILLAGLAGMPTTADASPFVIRVGGSESGGGGQGSSGGGAGGAGGAGRFGSLGGVRGSSLSGPVDHSETERAMPAESRVDGADGSGSGGGEGGALPLDPIGSLRPAPNTSPFGSNRLSQTVGTIVSTLTASDGRGSSLATATSPSRPGGLAGSVALLDLGGGEYLSVSTEVGGSLIPPRSSISPSGSATTAGVSSSVTGSTSSTAGSIIPGGILGVALPNVGTDLITFPGEGLLGDDAGRISAFTESTAIPNPEPASLFLLGTGVVIAARYARRKK